MSFVVIILLAVLAMRLLLYFINSRQAPEAAAGAGATRPGTPAEAERPDLVARPPARPLMALQRQDLQGIGTIELPVGPDWEWLGERLHQATTGTTLVIQRQPGNVRGHEREYLDSYNDVNIRDAPA